MTEWQVESVPSWTDGAALRAIWPLLLAAMTPTMAAMTRMQASAPQLRGLAS